MWFYVHGKSNDDQPWIGQVTISDKPRGSGTFELVRHVPVSELYNDPFSDADLIVGLMDYQRRGTLLRPIVTRIDPGMLSDFARTRIEGIFQGLLSGLAINNAKDPQFRGMSFGSASFRSWYGGGSHTVTSDNKTKKIEVLAARTQEFELASIGKVECRASSRVSQAIWSAEVHSDAGFSLTFEQLQSFDELHDWCFAIDSLFRFLVGFPGRPATFNVWLDQKLDIGDGQQVAASGSLDILGLDWIDDNPPILDECLHRRNEGGLDIPAVLEAFLPRRHDLLARFHAVQYCRFHSRNINDKFAVIMPVLEQHVRAKYKTKDEADYLSLEKSFFDWVQENGKPGFYDFCLKHLEVKKRKSASLPMLLGRAISAVNAKGFAIRPEYAVRLNDRRGSNFHSVSQVFDGGDARSFYNETCVATVLLLLSTLEDLGVDIELIAKRPAALRGLANICLRRPPASGAGADLAGDQSGTRTNV